MAPVLEAQAAEIAVLTGQIGRRVDVLSLGITDREGHLPLGEPGQISANGACRMFRAADGWMAANLAREEDHDLVPAWLECDYGGEPWALIERHAPQRTTAELLARADMLGLPVGAVGEVLADSPEAPRLRLGAVGRRDGPLKVVDLSAMWAGPMCGAVLATMGASVLRIEGVRRPDPTRTHTPRFFQALNGGKTELGLEFSQADARTRLKDEIAAADILVTGVRPRGLASLGLSTEAIFAANPGLVWVAVTGYGWTGPGASRVAFGDDAAAAGGLVRWTDGAPRFLGDALADPVTGLAGVIGALRGLQDGGGVLVDAALARCAAGAASQLRLRAAA